MSPNMERAGGALIAASEAWSKSLEAVVKGRLGEVGLPERKIFVTILTV